MFYYNPVECKTLELQTLIKEEFKCHPFYGYRKINKALEHIGFKVTEKQVRTEMHKLGLIAIYPKPKLSKANKEHEKYPYLLKDLKVVKINQVWATDITYIKLKGGVKEYINFYNDERFHQFLGYKTPNEIYYSNNI